jgi:4-carboxymuconolactone decarboxylase
VVSDINGMSAREMVKGLIEGEAIDTLLGHSRGVSPQVMSQARAMGDYLRYKSAIGTTLSELAILVTAREWTQDYEWYVHQPIALKAGIKPAIADAIADVRQPVGMSDDEEIVYEFSMELHRTKRVSDVTFARAPKSASASRVWST